MTNDRTNDRTTDKPGEWQQYWDSSGLYVHALRRGNPLLILLHGIGDWSESLLPLPKPLAMTLTALSLIFVGMVSHLATPSTRPRIMQKI